MMKKMLALLMALLLLPAAAFAEAMCFELKVTVDEANLTGILKSSGLFAGEDEEALCAAAAQLINGTGLRVVSQADGGQMELLLSDEVMLELSVLTSGEQLVLTSGMMDGYGLSVPAEMLGLAGEELAQMLQQLDAMVLLESLAAAAVQLDSVAVTSTRGNFSGHAYSGGVYCDSYSFDDAKIAEILGALLTEDLRAVICDVAGLMELDGAALLADLDAKNAQVAADNLYRYIVRMVSDENRQPIGASVVILEGENQLGTLSIGWDEDQLRLVAAFALDDVNYWHDHAVTFTQTGDAEGQEKISLRGTLQEFTAPKEDDFSYGKAVSGQMQLHSEWSLDVSTQEDSVSWHFSNRQRLGEAAPVEKIEWTGMRMLDGRVISSAAVSLNDAEYMNVKLTWLPCEPISTDVSGLTLCGLLDGDEELINEIAFAFGSEIAMRILKAMPMQLLMYLQ